VFLVTAAHKLPSRMHNGKHHLSKSSYLVNKNFSRQMSAIRGMGIYEKGFYPEFAVAGRPPRRMTKPFSGYFPSCARRSKRLLRRDETVLDRTTKEMAGWQRSSVLFSR
jgi:hypothetical protein